MNRRRGFRPAIALAVFVPALLSLGAGIAPANPLPPVATFVHVHPWDPTFCQTSTITQCSQIQQYTAEEGDIEFDFFPQNLMDQTDVTTFQAEVRWPPNWNYQGYETCIEGAVDEQVFYDHAVIRVVFAQPVPLGMMEMALVGRLRMQVDGFGGLEFADTGINEWTGAVSFAQAGAVDCYCWLKCNYWAACGADMTPKVLYLNGPSGGNAVGDIHGYLRENNGGQYPCSVTFTSDQSWLSIVATFENPWEFNIRVNADATDLPPGEYEGLVQAESDCHDCVLVRFHVEPTSSVPAEPGRVEDVSWGSVKSRYR